MLLGAVLTGCATTGPQRTPTPLDETQLRADWVAHKARIEQLRHFVLNGRVASAELDLRADIRWRQDADQRFELRLAGPFGAGAVELRGDPQLVEIRSGDGSQFTPDPEAWIRQRYGWTLPIGGLRHWVLGLPIPGQPSQMSSFDDKGRLASLQQNGWQLTYAEYRAQGEYDLPRRFELTNGQVKLKLLIDRWDELPQR